MGCRCQGGATATRGREVEEERGEGERKWVRGEVGGVLANRGRSRAFSRSLCRVH